MENRTTQKLIVELDKTESRRSSRLDRQPMSLLNLTVARSNICSHSLKSSLRLDRKVGSTGFLSAAHAPTIPMGSHKQKGLHRCSMSTSSSLSSLRRSTSSRLISPCGTHPTRTTTSRTQTAATVILVLLHQLDRLRTERYRSSFRAKPYLTTAI